MRRADRLFQIILALGGEQVITARRLASRLRVTSRTIYRDISELVETGVPIEGEAGVGYRLRRGYKIPPTVFTSEELQALHLGVSMVCAWADPSLAAAAQRIVAKVEAVLPEPMRPKLAYGAMIVPGGHVPSVIGDHLSVLRKAVTNRRRITFVYPRPFAERSERRVRPLALAYWGGSWTLGAWCESVGDYRTFRVDGICDLQITGEVFNDEPARGLAGYLAAAPMHDAVLGVAVDSLKVDEKLWPVPA